MLHYALILPVKSGLSEIIIKTSKIDKK